MEVVPCWLRFLFWLCILPSGALWIWFAVDHQWLFPTLGVCNVTSKTLVDTSYSTQYIISFDIQQTSSSAAGNGSGCLIDVEDPVLFALCDPQLEKILYPWGWDSWGAPRNTTLSVQPGLVAPCAFSGGRVLFGDFSRVGRTTAVFVAAIATAVIPIFYLGLLVCLRICDSNPRDRGLWPDLCPAY
ncbi:hypothetical protein PAPYR_10017 [Paratrimastix pyriformis]|uniref:Uncharacterized protein n=1 Tax=Paratrimastix pyriformis TaxID=342808 RepID=A0ABQ8U6Y1_9EUKA|nr:hypothetical protein PAPYR_10017 [Paratrimastix pyriformis]